MFDTIRSGVVPCEVPTMTGLPSTARIMPERDEAIRAAVE